MKYIVLFDFGHGTREYMDPKKGKHSPGYTIENGKKVYTLYEGEWTRDVGMRIVQALKDLGIDCRVIVPEKQDIPLTERCRRVNNIVRSNPDAQCILVSVHINAAGSDGEWHNATGFTIWVTTRASEKSRKLAQTIYSYADKFGLKGNRAVPAERYWTANYTIITDTSCPAVLTENLFQDNRDEVDYLLSEEGKETIVNLHVAGLLDYMGYPHGIVTAKKP